MNAGTEGARVALHRHNPLRKRTHRLPPERAGHRLECPSGLRDCPAGERLAHDVAYIDDEAFRVKRDKFTKPLLVPLRQRPPLDRTVQQDGCGLHPGRRSPEVPLTLPAGEHPSRGNRDATAMRDSGLEIDDERECIIKRAAWREPVDPVPGMAGNAGGHVAVFIGSLVEHPSRLMDVSGDDVDVAHGRIRQ